MRIQPVYTISMIQHAEKELPVLVLYTRLEDLVYLKSGLDAEYFYSGMPYEECKRIRTLWVSGQCKKLLLHANLFWMYESCTQASVLWYKPDTESPIYHKLCGE